MSDQETIDEARDLLDQMSEQERFELFHEYCVYCGSDDPDCQCWNDE